MHDVLPNPKAHVTRAKLIRIGAIVADNADPDLFGRVFLTDRGRALLAGFHGDDKSPLRPIDLSRC